MVIAILAFLRNMGKEISSSHHIIGEDNGRCGRVMAGGC
jgi:hypothetical protein